MSFKRIIKKRLIWDIGLIAFAIAATAAGKYLSDRIPALAIYFCITALIYLIAGVVDLHQTLAILESMSESDQDKR